MELFTWGDNKKGQLGLGTKNKIVLKPQKVELDQTIIKVKCGYKNTIILTKDFNAYVCGDNKQNTISPKKIKIVESFVEVLDLPPIEKIFCTNFFAVLTKDNSVYIWGQTDLIDFSKPFLIEEFKNESLDLSIGRDFLIIIDTNYLVYSSGANDQGQLGYENTIENSEFRCIEKLSASLIKSIVCGADFCLGISGINSSHIPSGGNNSELQRNLQTSKMMNSTPKQIEKDMPELSMNDLNSPEFAKVEKQDEELNDEVRNYRSVSFAEGQSKNSDKPNLSHNNFPMSRKNNHPANLPLIRESERELDKMVRFSQTKSVLRNEKLDQTKIDWSKELKQLEDLEEMYNLRITPKGFQNKYSNKIEDMRVYSKGSAAF